MLCAAASLLLLYPSAVAASAAVAWPSAGERGADDVVLSDFMLEAVDGTRVALWSERPGRRITVVAILGDDAAAGGESPSVATARVLATARAAYGASDVCFLPIHSGTAPSARTALAAAVGAAGPLLIDPWRRAATACGAANGGTLVLVDAEFRVLYRGAADDRFEGGVDRGRAQNDFLTNALDSALAGETVEPDATEPAGGPLTDGALPPAPTFHRDVAPILWKHCVECHRPGQPGPMAFLDVDEVTGWAPMIAEVVENRRMPPWFADARYGHWRNERRLSDTDKETLEQWAATGAAAGDPAHAPPVPTFEARDWKIGTPDRVLELPEPQPVPAEGVVQYRYVTLDPHFDEDLWVQAVEVVPTARAATHHVIAYLLPAGMSMTDALRRPEAILERDAIGGWAPGEDPLQLPDGQGFLVKKGSTILFELHYTPNGTATTDRTRVGIRLSRVPVTQPSESSAIMHFSFRIKPHDDDATFQATRGFREPALLTRFMPHMHLRGKAFRYELLKADGSSRILLDVPKYDFNWQVVYTLTEPLRVEAGDRLRITAKFDNSKNNPFNPNPGALVTWGDQTFNEMMIGYYDYLEAPPPR